MVISQLNPILYPYVENYETPGDVILSLICYPVVYCALPQKINEIHINDEKNVISDSIPSVQIHIECSEVPDLDDCQGAHYVNHCSSGTDKSSMNAVEERVLPADHVNKNQIIDQLHVFNFFLFFIVKKIHLEAVFSFHLI